MKQPLPWEMSHSTEEMGECSVYPLLTGQEEEATVITARNYEMVAEGMLEKRYHAPGWAFRETEHFIMYEN